MDASGVGTPWACRRGVVLVSGDSSAAAFLADLVEEHAPGDGHPLELTRGATSVAAVGRSRRCRLIVIDGEPPDISAGALIEAIRVADPTIPILLIRYSPNRSRGAKAPLNGVHVEEGPFVRCGIEGRLVSLLRSGKSE
jgi:hypothetical protein